MSDQRLQAVLSIAGADAPLTVHAVRGSEEVSRAFRYEVDFSSDALGIDALAGARVSLVITAPRGGERRIFGAASELNLLVGSNSEEGAKLRYRAVARRSGVAEGPGAV